jgi:hypothetical protein
MRKRGRKSKAEIIEVERLKSIIDNKKALNAEKKPETKNLINPV